MAHGFAQGGLIVGFVTVIICGSMAYLGLYLLSLCAAHPSIPFRTASFSAISQVTYPNASILFDLAIAIKCFGVSISYLLIFGKLMPQVIHSFQSSVLSSSASVQIDSEILWFDRRLWITLAMILLVPISFLPTLDSLRHTSYVALIGVVNLIFVVVFKFFFSGPLPIGSNGAEFHWIKIDTSFLTALPLFVFAYTCAQNIFSVHNEMIVNSSRQMKAVLGSCIGSAIVTYEIVGMLGYLTFGSKVSSNLISDYDSSIMISIARLTISILVLFSYPLQLYPCRSSLMKVFHHQSPENGDQPQVTYQGLEQVVDQEREFGLASQDDRPGFRREPDSIKLFVGITTFLLSASFLIAVQVERLETILGFVGSTGSTTISYILPGVFFLKLFPEPEEEGTPLTKPIRTIPEVIDGSRDQTNSSIPAHGPNPQEDREADEDRTGNDGENGDVMISRTELMILRKLSSSLVLIGSIIMVVCFSLNIHDAFFAS